VKVLNVHKTDAQRVNSSAVMVVALLVRKNVLPSKRVKLDAQTEPTPPMLLNAVPLKDAPSMLHSNAQMDLAQHIHQNANPRLFAQHTNHTHAAMVDVLVIQISALLSDHALEMKHSALMVAAQSRVSALN
jgi:hypothetical protein